MQVIQWAHFLENGLPSCEKKLSMTVGVFDGVHRGHQALIGRVVSYNAGYTSAVVTFRENHKIEKTSHEDTGARGTRDILTFERRAELLEGLGVQILIVVDFTDEFRRMKGQEFLEILLKHCDIGFFAVGGNFRCGYELDTDAEAIRDFFAARNIPAEIAPEVLEGGLPVSSSRIRSCLAAGDIKQAELLLGRN
jgi:riboflavin kinase/FMN adenylyltransferase